MNEHRDQGNFLPTMNRDGTAAFGPIRLSIVVSAWC
jgi:hypothetical protein